MGSTGIRTPARLMVVLAAGCLAATCAAADPTDPADKDEGGIPGSVVLVRGTEPLLSLKDDDHETSVLYLAVGGGTGLLHVVFQRADGEGVYHPTPGQQLQVQIQDTAVAYFQQSPPEGFTGNVLAMGPGSTSLRFGLVEEGESLFNSVPLVLHVAGDTLETVFDYDLGGLAAGDQPVGWAPIWETDQQQWQVAELYGFRHLSHVSQVSLPRGLVLDEPGDVVNTEILARVMATSTIGTQNRLIARATGAAGSETAYHFDFRPDLIRISKYEDGAFSIIGAPQDWERDTYRWYWMRFRVQGNRLLARVWDDGQPEPAEWTIEREDRSIQAGGGVGFGSFSDAGNRYWDHISIAVGGESAVLPDPPDTILQGRITQAYQVLAAANDDAATGSVVMSPGSVLSDLRITFHGQGGRHYHIDSDGSLQVLIDDTGVVSFQPDVDDPFAGQLHAHSPGTTQLRLRYRHAAQDLFTSAPIMIVVEGI